MASRDASGRGRVVLGSGAEVPFDKLLLCTGGQPRTFQAGERFTIPGADLRNVHTLRTSGDAHQIHDDAVAVRACVLRGRPTPSR